MWAGSGSPARLGLAGETAEGPWGGPGWVVLGVSDLGVVKARFLAEISKLLFQVLLRYPRRCAYGFEREVLRLLGRQYFRLLQSIALRSS